MKFLMPHYSEMNLWYFVFYVKMLANCAIIETKIISKLAIVLKHNYRGA